MLNVVTLAQMRPDSGVGAGPMSLLLLVLMGIATAFLVRNMNGRLKGLPASFAPASTGDAESRDEELEDDVSR